MRIVPFPADEPLPGQEAWCTNLEAALRGESHGPAAEAWRELRGEVRSLAPAMTPAFEGRLTQRLERLGALERGAADVDGRAGSEDAPETAAGISAASAPTRDPRALTRLLRDWCSGVSHRRAAGGAVATVLVALVALVAVLFIAGPRGSRPAIESLPRTEKTPAVAPGASANSTNTASSGSFTSATSAKAVQVAPALSAPSAGGAGSSPVRVQQLAASLTLGSTAASLQSISDRVAQLAVRDGGYVQSSNVQVQHQGVSEATLALRLPSARLGAALAAIGRLAPIRAENQSLQDITDAYDAARQRLSDAEAERRALLRALAAATTEAQIHALRQRLAASRAALARAHSSVNSVSQRASTAEVEVSIVGDARAVSEGLTLHRGLHDAGRVLVVALVVLLIAAAILVPLALVLATLLGARSAWRRSRREHALDGH